MAADWLKVRSDLYRDPRVSVMADVLMRPDGELASFVSQNCQRDMTVTRNVMRNVTVGALVSVWGVMRQRGDRDGDDLKCYRVTVSVLDDIADLPGFGDAMELSGWVVQTDEGIVFPGFFKEYNADPASRQTSSGAERQRRYRESQRSISDVTDGVTRDVTRDVTVTPREEKRREEIQEQDQKKGAGDKSPPLVLPDWLSADVWADWHKYRNSRKGWTAKAKELSLRTLTELWAQGHDPRLIVNKSIECGWSGLFPPKAGPPSGPMGQVSKTLGGLQRLEEMKNVGLAERRGLDRATETYLLELGPNPGDGFD